MKTIKNLTAEELRKSILQLAIQGKLVKQDPNDEPASELVKRIYEEKNKLVAEGKIKKDKNQSYIFKGDDNCYYEKIGNNKPVKLDDLPFDIPKNWMWIRQKNLCWLDNGVKTKGNKFPYLEAKVIRGIKKPIILDEGIIVDSNQRVILVDGENSGEIMTPPYKGYMGSTFKIFSATKLFNYNFLLFIFLLNKELYKNSKVGAAIPHLNKELFKESFIAVPPLEEQQRIVDKIDSFEPLLEKYNKVEKELSKLEKEFPEKLKKSILQYAIEGKLVNQDPNDEPASVLLERIKQEKERLIKECKIKRDKNETYIYQGDDKNYYENIPENWRLCTIKDICSYGNTIFYFSPVIGDWLLELEDIESGSSIILNRKSIVSNTNMNSKVYFDKNMILYSKLRPYLDKVLIAPERGVATSEIVPFYSYINSKFLIYFLKSPYFLNRVKNLMYGVKMPRLGTNDMLSTIFFLPPLEEQSKIVNKITEIFKAID